MIVMKMEMKIVDDALLGLFFFLFSFWIWLFGNLR